MTWLIRVLISTIWPFLAVAGTTTRVAGMALSSGVVDAGGLRDDHVGRAGPERAVVHGGDGGNALGGGEADVGLHLGDAGARAQVESHDVGDGVLLGKHVDG